MNNTKNVIEDLLEYIEIPPDKNCSCHVSLPCNDCVDYSHLRETIRRAKAILKSFEQEKL